MCGGGGGEAGRKGQRTQASSSSSGGHRSLCLGHAGCLPGGPRGPATLQSGGASAGIYLCSSHLLPSMVSVLSPRVNPPTVLSRVTQPLQVVNGDARPCAHISVFKVWPGVSSPVFPQGCWEQLLRWGQVGPADQGDVSAGFGSVHEELGIQKRKLLFACSLKPAPLDLQVRELPSVCPQQHGAAVGPIIHMCSLCKLCHLIPLPSVTVAV